MGKFLMTSHLDSSDREIKKFQQHVYRKRNVTRCIAEVLAMETMSAAPIQDKAAISLVVVARQGMSGIQAGDEVIPIKDNR